MGYGVDPAGDRHSWCATGGGGLPAGSGRSRQIEQEMAPGTRRLRLLAAAGRFLRRLHDPSLGADHRPVLLQLGRHRGQDFGGVVELHQRVRVPELREAVVHSFELMLYFCVIPIVMALFLTSLITGPRRPPWTVTRAILFVPQVLPPVAVAVMWQWMYGDGGFINQVLHWVGLGSDAQAWLASFSWAFPAVGFVGSWVTLGLCLVLFIAGAQKIPVELYEAIATDGGGRFRQFRWVTLPQLRGEVVLAAIVTAIGALSAFDIVFVMTGGGPGVATIVPGLLVYQLAFTSDQVGQASALAVVLSLLVLAVITAIRLLGRERS